MTRLRKAGIAFLMSLILGACQAGVGVPGATESLDGEPTDAGSQNEPVGLDGTLTIKFDASNGGGGSSTEEHYVLVVKVHLVAKDNLGGPSFVDAGSTYTYTGSSRSDGAEALGKCGHHSESIETGGGLFASPGHILGSYGHSNPVVSLSIQAAYTSEGFFKYLCNGQTLATGPGSSSASCGEPSGGYVVGTILPGGVQIKAPGQVVDFACTTAFVLGSGGRVVTGTLTSR